ncbi:MULTISPECIES: response regulator transcription factor [Klebsiella]|uniref:response regulator transcription factor n=1 Tax=Klebsiella TaxID=570 RepID=UPI00065161DA|nr:MULTISPECIES: response regulator transcription factor [Klebsiella]KMH47620.1 two-component system OmpR family, response regulator PhoP [Klebsiella quasipneumoniae]HBR1315914.1 response regulator transcription factor [Klebsiella quasipneumoniae subsp. quasipneumoniae]HDT2604699.1 response regulator transcription factor [Klebsiella quasipneumoniae subsp. similipneumoniae]
MTLRVAIIEDSVDLLDELLAFLRFRGFNAWGVHSAEAFWRQLHRDPVDIVLIDIGLPGEDGFSVLDYLHEIGEYGLIVMTARGHEQDKLQAFNLGADCFFIKPLNFSVLAETIHSLGARLQQENAAAPVPVPAIEQPASASWQLQPERLTDPCGTVLPLTQQEYRLLARLMRNRSEVCRKVDLHAYLFPDESEPELHRIDVVISCLRNKARLHGMVLPIRAIFGKGLAFIP